MRQKTASEELTPFARWLDAAMANRGTNLKRVSESVEADYSYLWKMMNAHKSTYAQYQRPGYDLARNLGEHLGDTAGALAAAKYENASVREDVGKYSIPELIREADPGLAQVVYNYLGTDDRGRENIKSIAEREREMATRNEARRGAIGGRLEEDQN